MKFFSLLYFCYISFTISFVCGLYFPPLSSSSKWEESSVEQLGWNASAVEPLIQYLNSTNTKAFILLKDGKIVLENYLNGFQPDDYWYWASAGKVLFTALTGICQQEGYCKVSNKVSEYCGPGWTSALIEKEDLITVQHLLSMTSGLDVTGLSLDPDTITYKQDAGTAWDYQHVFAKLMDVIVNATSTSGSVDRDDALALYNKYNREKLKVKVGMKGSFVETDGHIVYWSDARSMARYGILSLSKGRWNEEVIINEHYFSESITPSQELNEAYGYMWWLNGYESYLRPGYPQPIAGYVVPSAPADAYFGMGKNTQRLHVVPSLGLVVVRLGDAWIEDDKSYAVSEFDEILWKNHLNNLVGV